MVIVDTDILIGAKRGNEIAKSIINKYSKNPIYITLITELELQVGATNAQKKKAVDKVVQTHQTLPINKKIGEIALNLIKLYNSETSSLYLADTLIAATCIFHNYKLISFNTTDFKKIKGLHLAK